MDLVVRTLTAADLDGAAAVVAEAYNSPGNRRAELHRCLALEPDGWLLATLDGQPAGVVGAIDYGPFASMLSLPFEAAPVALVPDASAPAIALLPRYGFQVQRGPRHMHRGAAAPPRQRSLIFRLASYALG